MSEERKNYASLITPVVKSVPQDTDYIYKPITCKLEKYIDLKPNVYEIDNQGQIGSCTANATTSALEDILNYKKAGKPLSRLFVYWTTRNLIENRAGQEGASVRDVIRSCKHFGVCDEKNWPYIEKNVDIKPSTESFSLAKNQVITRYEKIDTSKGKEVIINSIKSALNEKLPIVFSMVIGDKFMDLRGPWRKQKYPKINKTDNKQAGGHAMTIIGYDDSARNFLVENSWGKEWGDGGFCGIDYNSLIDGLMEAFIVRQFNGISIISDNTVKVSKEQAGGNFIFGMCRSIRDFFLNIFV